MQVAEYEDPLPHLRYRGQPTCAGECQHHYFILVEVDDGQVLVKSADMHKVLLSFALDMSM